MSSACPLCHTIRGTDAAGVMGPDLTHVGSRASLAAGVFKYNRRNLAAWIAEPRGSSLATTCRRSDSTRATCSRLRPTSMD